MKKTGLLLCVLLIIGVLSGCSNVAESDNSTTNHNSSKKVANSSEPYSQSSYEVNANASSETAQIIKETMEKEFAQVEVSELTSDISKPDEVSLSVNITIPDVSENDAKNFFDRAAAAISNSNFVDSSYNHITFMINNTTAFLTVNRDSQNAQKLVSNFMSISTDDATEQMLELEYQKNSFFSKIDMMKSFQDDMDDLYDQYGIER